MSSVVISGDVSGSVTLQAPSAAGTTVLTLPATSGTVVTTATSSGISGSAITTGTVGVSVGGTGANTLTANNVILGNGTSAVQFVAPGSNGNVLTSNGTTWTSAAAGGGSLQTQLFTSPGTWTKPSSCTQVRVTVVGGGGGGGVPGNPGTASSGGTSSFGPLVSATGGGGGRGPAVKGGSGGGSITAPATAFFAGQGINNSAFNPTLINVVGGTSIYSNPSQSGVTYTSTLGGVAGAGGVAPANNAPGSCSGGGGGVAIAIVPVAAPVAVTVGTGGSGFTVDGGGVSGAVVVEWVG